MIKNILVLFIISILNATTCLAESFSDKPWQPLIKLHVPNEFTPQRAPQWDQLESFILNSNYGAYILFWEGRGGSVSMGKKLIKTIQTAQAQGKHINIVLIGPSASMHALVVCYADFVSGKNLENYLMFHADGESVKSGQSIIRKRVFSPATSTINKELKHCIDTNNLKQEDVDKIWSGYEVWKMGFDTLYFIDKRPLLEIAPGNPEK